MRLGLYRKIEIARKQLPGLDDDGVWRERLRSSFGVNSRKDLNMHQLATLVQDLARDGARFTAGKKSRNPGVKSLSREDWVEVPDDSPFAAEKRMIAALWRKLGYSMDWRGKRERIAETESALRVDRVLARSQVLKKLLETGESQDAYAVAALERLALLQEENELRRAEREKDRRLRKAEKEREWKERRALAELRLSGARQNAGVTSPAVKPQDLPRDLPRNDEERAALLEDVINRRLSELLSCPPENILRLMKDLNESRRLLTELRGGENAGNGAVTVAWSDGQ